MNRCSLVQSAIYCYGGYSNFHTKDAGGYIFQLPMNDLLKLDITNLLNNTQQLQWQKLSNKMNDTSIQPIGSIASNPFYSDNSCYILGGWPDNLNISPFVKNRFHVYHPEIDQWKQLLLPLDVNYFMDISTVNIRNDTIWVWGSFINSTNQYIPQALYTFNYKTNIWYSQYSLSESGRVYHSVTLGRNGIIYILGGYFQSDQVSNSQYANFSQVLTFDTNSSQWLIINPTGDQPSNRILHSTTQITSSDLFVVYGGIQLENSQGFAADDICYIYDSINNSFKKVMLASNINRAGHFATMHGSNYLILVFGFIEFNLPADNLSVLNMTDIHNPTWLISFNATLHVENINKLNQSSIIAIIVVFAVSFFVSE
ncbi:unnamed protein product [Cunninghamella echinulata]